MTNTEFWERAGQITGGQWGHFMGIPVHLTPYMPDGKVMVLRPGYVEPAAPASVLLGTRPWTIMDVAREEARRIVRHGMADVLAWLGEGPGPAPSDPYPAVSTATLILSIKGATHG